MIDEIDGHSDEQCVDLFLGESIEAFKLVSHCLVRLYFLHMMTIHQNFDHQLLKNNASENWDDTCETGNPGYINWSYQRFAGPVCSDVHGEPIESSVEMSLISNIALMQPRQTAVE